MIRFAIVLPLALLAACGSRTDDVGGVTPEEDRMLNDAASSLDANAMTVPDAGAATDNTAAGNAQ